MQNVLGHDGLGRGPECLGDHEASVDATPRIVGTLAYPNVGAVVFELEHLGDVGGNALFVFTHRGDGSQ